MPMYTYQCDSCEKVDDDFRSIENRDRVHRCDCRSGALIRVFNPGSTRVMTQEFHKPIEMLSIAVDSERQIREFQIRNPGVMISVDRNSPVFGVPIAHTRQEKLRILKNERFEELS